MVIIGAGGAGYSAAVTAHDLGAKVIVLEKMPITGGNTQIASGGMNAAGTKQQAAQGIKDSWEIMRDDTLKGGKNMGIPALVEILARDSTCRKRLAYIFWCGPERNYPRRRGQRQSVPRAEGRQPCRPGAVEECCAAPPSSAISTCAQIAA